VNDLKRHLNDVELEWNRALLAIALISGADVSIPAFELQDDILNIYRDLN